MKEAEPIKAMPIKQIEPTFVSKHAHNEEIRAERERIIHEMLTADKVHLNESERFLVHCSMVSEFAEALHLDHQQKMELCHMDELDAEHFEMDFFGCNHKIRLSFCDMTEEDHLNATTPLKHAFAKQWLTPHSKVNVKWSTVPGNYCATINGDGHRRLQMNDSQFPDLETLMEGEREQAVTALVETGFTGSTGELQLTMPNVRTAADNKSDDLDPRFGAETGEDALTETVHSAVSNETLDQMRANLGPGSTV